MGSGMLLHLDKESIQLHLKNFPFGILSE